MDGMEAGHDAKFYTGFHEIGVRGPQLWPAFDKLAV